MPKPFRLTAPVPREWDVHVGVADMLRNWARPSVLWFHVANQQVGGAKRGAMLKRMGRKAGVSDFFILDRRAAYFVEVKRPGESRRKTQVDFQNAATYAGSSCYVVDSIDAAARLFNEIGILSRTLMVAA